VLNAFQSAMDQIGTLHGDPTSPACDAFTCSDFGRTFRNGQGSDHGWAAIPDHGGAVHGQKTTANSPRSPSTARRHSTGRWIPPRLRPVLRYPGRVRVDSSNLATVFPNLGRFASSNLDSFEPWLPFLVLAWRLGAAPVPVAARHPGRTGTINLLLPAHPGGRDFAS